MFVKIAPDLDEAQVGVMAATLRHNGIDGVIATNTTVARDAVNGLLHADEAVSYTHLPRSASTSPACTRRSPTTACCCARPRR